MQAIVVEPGQVFEDQGVNGVMVDLNILESFRKGLRQGASTAVT